MTGDTRAVDWVSGGDTGISSKAIWTHMMGGTPERWSCPLDPSDFGRCHRLLLLMPEWRARMPEMAKYGKWWAGLADAWDELDALYLEELPTGRCQKLYDRMHAIEAASRKRTSPAPSSPEKAPLKVSDGAAAKGEL